ncbi:hypothetical protein TWF751_011123 [Orbilia oligospora]|nr:hypothetical protein TWF751_011123 [Orbilia oligospora]
MLGFLPGPCTLHLEARHQDLVLGESMFFSLRRSFLQQKLHSQSCRLGPSIGVGFSIPDPRPGLGKLVEGPEASVGRRTGTEFSPLRAPINLGILSQNLLCDGSMSLLSALCRRVSS